MPKGKSVDAVLQEGEQIARVWESNQDFAMAGVTRASLGTMIEEARSARTEVEDLRTQLTQKVNEANEKAEALMAVVTRARTGIRGFYGPDSSQYEQAGGTRLSERKPRASRKTETN